jgi:hypothetical protein
MPARKNVSAQPARFDRVLLSLLAFLGILFAPGLSKVASSRPEKAKRKKYGQNVPAEGKGSTAGTRDGHAVGLI